jgi:CAAX protease family protein
MTTFVLQRHDSVGSKPVAPFWHTGILVAVMAGLAIGGATFQHQGGLDSGTHSSLIPLYLSLLAAEWGLLRFVRRGSLRSGTTLSDLIGRDWPTSRSMLRDCLLGLSLWGLWELLEFGWRHWLGVHGAVSTQGMLPRDRLEIALWVAVSISAGFCEEVAFRGYCQRQFAALTHSRWIGLLLQALLFGVGHGYEGVQACLQISLYGVLFGLLAFWRNSLRPGMICHAWSDIAVGLFGF